MALQLDLATSNFGVAFKGAYYRVVTASVGTNVVEPLVAALICNGIIESPI